MSLKFLFFFCRSSPYLNILQSQFQNVQFQSLRLSVRDQGRGLKFEPDTDIGQKGTF